MIALCNQTPQNGSAAPELTSSRGTYSAADSRAMLFGIGAERLQRRHLDRIDRGPLAGRQEGRFQERRAEQVPDDRLCDALIEVTARGRFRLAREACGHQENNASGMHRPGTGTQRHTKSVVSHATPIGILVPIPRW